MKTANRRRGIGAGVAIALLSLTCLIQPADAGDPIDERIETGADGTITIENLSGSVHVVGWEEKEIWIRGELGERTRGLDIEADHTGDRSEVVIEVDIPRRARKIGETELDIRVPLGSSLVIETVSANVTVIGVRGDLELETVSGSIEVEDAPGGIEAQTVSGLITITGARAHVEAESMSGTLEIHESDGQLEAEVVSGAIKVFGGEFESVELESVSGSIRYEGDLTDGGQYDFTDMSGSIVLLLPGDVDAEFDITSFSGSIVTDFDARVHREKYGTGKSCHFVRGDGDAVVTINSFSGSVRVEER